MTSHQVFIKSSSYDDHTVLVIGCLCGEFLEMVEAQEPMIYLDEVVEIAWSHFDE